jgi:hypothetical protein
MNGMYEQPKVTRVIQVTGLNVAGQPRQVMQVEFMIGEHGPFIELIPKDEFNAATVKQKLIDFATQLHQLTT